MNTAGRWSRERWSHTPVGGPLSSVRGKQASKQTSKQTRLPGFSRSTSTTTHIQLRVRVGGRPPPLLPTPTSVPYPYLHNPASEDDGVEHGAEELFPQYGLPILWNMELPGPRASLGRLMSSQRRDGNVMARGSIIGTQVSLSSQLATSICYSE